jgi:hypothetical protein
MELIGDLAEADRGYDKVLTTCSPRHPSSSYVSTCYSDGSHPMHAWLLCVHDFALSCATDWSTMGPAAGWSQGSASFIQWNERSICVQADSAMERASMFHPSWVAGLTCVCVDHHAALFVLCAGSLRMDSSSR